MTEKGNSVSTVGIYLRNLRRIYNISINEGFTPKEYYPFGIDKYVVPSSVNHKRALTFEQVNLIFNHKCYHPNMEKFRDIWMFSYLCQGMNFKDIANLKWSNLDNDKLYFIRQKSSRANKGKQKKTIVYLIEQAKNINNVSLM